MSASEPLFYFGAMSPYSWFAAERIGALLPQARWQPLLLGAVFKESGRTSWGLTDARDAAVADCEARAAERGLGPIRWPERWPTSDLTIARAMTFAEMRGALEPFALAAMRMCFLEGVDLGELGAALEAARRSGVDAEELREAIGEDDVKQRLRAVTQQALDMGVFGVPTVAIGEELYWGDDTLERAAASYAVLSKL